MQTTVLPSSCCWPCASEMWNIAISNPQGCAIASLGHGYFHARTEDVQVNCYAQRQAR